MTSNFDINSYVPVTQRVDIFWNKYPEGRIITKVTYLDAAKHTARMVIVKAKVFKDRTNRSPDSTGYEKEREGSGGANQTAFLENCETSAIGRALANLNIAVTKNRPSQEEMLAVQATEKEHQRNISLLEVYASTLDNEDETKIMLRKQWKTIKSSPVEAFKLALNLNLNIEKEPEETPSITSV